MKTIRQAKWCYMICSVLLAALGIYVIARPFSSAVLFCRIIGGVSVLIGLTKILGYLSHDLYNLAFQFDLALGIFMAVWGLVLLLRTERVIAFLPVVIGLFVLIDGVFKLQTSIDAKRFGLTHWWLILVGALFCAVLGTLLIADPFGSSKLLMIFVGISLTVDGAQNIFNAVYTVKMIKEHSV